MNLLGRNLKLKTTMRLRIAGLWVNNTQQKHCPRECCYGSIGDNTYTIDRASNHTGDED
jgi:hypothetical protein